MIDGENKSEDDDEKLVATPLPFIPGSGGSEDSPFMPVVCIWSAREEAARVSVSEEHTHTPHVGG